MNTWWPQNLGYTLKSAWSCNELIMLDLDLFQRQTEVVWNSFSFWKITELRSWKTDKSQPRVKRDTKKTEILCLKMQDPENQGFKSYFSRTDDSSNQREETQEHEYSAEGFQSFAQDTTLHGARFLFVSNVSRRVVWNIATVSYTHLTLPTKRIV